MSSTTLLSVKNWTWDFNNVVASQWSSGFTTGRINGRAFYMTSPTTEVTYGRLYKILPSVQTSFVAGFATKYSQQPGIGSSGCLYTFTTLAGTDILRVFVYPNGSLAFRNSAGSDLAVSAAGLINPNAWEQLECKVLVNGASGSVTMHLNGVEVIAATTVNIGSTGISYMGPLATSNDGWKSSENGAVGITIMYDDVWLADTATGDIKDFIGDAHVETLYPNGDGSHSDWTPNSGSAHYSRVNEHSAAPYPDDDTSYVSTATVNNIDSWAYDDLSIVSGTVYGLQTNLYARKTDANLRQLKPVVVRSATTYVGSVTQTLASGYVDSTEIYEEDPSTSAAWTVTNVNAAEFGVKATT